MEHSHSFQSLPSAFLKEYSNKARDLPFGAFKGKKQLSHDNFAEIKFNTEIEGQLVKFSQKEAPSHVTNFQGMAHRKNYCNHIYQNFTPGKWNPRCHCKLTVIPDNVLRFEILPYLTKTELCSTEIVCRRFRFLSTDRSLWNDFDFRGAYRSLLAENKRHFLVRLLAKHGAEIRKVFLCDIEVDDDVMKVFAKFLRKLEDLRMCNTELVTNDSMLPLITNNSYTLRKLYLGGCVNLDNDTLTAIVENCKQLKSLTLRSWDFINDSHIGYIKQNLLYLKELSIADCLKVTQASVINLLSENSRIQSLNLKGLWSPKTELFYSLAKFTPKLKKLNLSVVNPFLNSNTFTQESFAQFITSCNNLESLTMNSVAKSLQKTSLLAISMHSKNLQVLELNNCVSIDPEFLQLLAKNCPNLTNASFGRGKCESSCDWKQLLSTCKNLKRIVLPASVDDVVVKSLKEEFKNIVVLK